MEISHGSPLHISCAQICVRDLEPKQGPIASRWRLKTHNVTAHLPLAMPYAHANARSNVATTHDDDDDDGDDDDDDDVADADADAGVGRSG